MYELLSLEPGDSLWISVLSGSMAPRYLPGDEIRVIAIAQDDIGSAIKPGTVAVFYEEGRFYFHRVLRIGLIKKRVYQKGDANREGSWIGFERILGAVGEGRRKEGDGYILYNDRARGPFLPDYYMIQIRKVKEKLKRAVKRCLFMN
jgi:hypothetical protein